MVRVTIYLEDEALQAARAAEAHYRIVRDVTLSQAARLQPTAGLPDRPARACGCPGTAAAPKQAKLESLSFLYNFLNLAIIAP